MAKRGGRSLQFGTRRTATPGVPQVPRARPAPAFVNPKLPHARLQIEIRRRTLASPRVPQVVA